jgi:protein O-GlcNAc transferase
MSSPLEAAASLLRNRQAISAERLLEGISPEQRGSAEWHLLGIARHALGKRAAAVEALRKALAIRADLPDAACALATVLAEIGQWTDAEVVLQEAVARRADHAQAHFNLAWVLERRGAGQEALVHYDRVLSLDAGHESALLNRGVLRIALEQATHALCDLDTILRRNPHHVAALVNRSRALLLLHRDEEALDAAQAAIRLDPARREARLATALALASLQRVDEAQACMRELDPAWDARAAFVARALDRQDDCYWTDRDRLLHELRDALASEQRARSIAGAGLLHRILALPVREEEILQAASAVAANVPAAAAPAVLATHNHDRIRVGFLSAGVSLHPDYYLLSGLLKALDRSRFEVLLLACNADDGSEERREMASAADIFVDASRMPSAGIVERARALSLDLVVDTGGYFRAARPEVLKARIACVQAAFMGVPATYGGGIVDYRLSDALATPPPAQQYWAEKLVLLPAPHYAYAYAGPVGSAGARSDHGLPPQGIVFSCFNQCWKIEPEVFGIWMRLLDAVPHATLWLLDEGERARSNLQAAARALAVSPDRLVFAPRVPFAAHLGRLQHADVFLDTLHYNAVTTAFDTLWAGVPVVTRAGQAMASRLGASIVASAGLAQLVATSSEDYERIALRLARHPDFLAVCKQAARAARSGPAFHLSQRVQALERAFVAMVERGRAGNAPATLVID